MENYPTRNLDYTNLNEPILYTDNKTTGCNESEISFH